MNRIDAGDPAGYPNLFCLYGQNTNPVVGSVVFVLECQVNDAVTAIDDFVVTGPERGG